MADEANVRVHRIPCRSCGRQFVAESLAKHEPICLKQGAKKRKVFDSTKQRADGTDISYRQMKQAQKKEIKPPKSHWRAKHEDFINAIRSAKGVSVAMERGGPLPPPPPPSINPDYIQCPHCGRRFNEKAAERHIGFCKEQQMRGKPQANVKAKAKADARNSYQVPKPKGRGTTQTAGYSSPGMRGSPAAPRGATGAPGARASPTTGSGRTPVSTTGSGYGRQPAPATRGRPSPSTNQYQSRGGRF